MDFMLLWLAFAIATSVIASQKGRSGFGWLVLGAIFGIFALIVIACIPKVQKTEEPKPSV